MQYMVKAIQAAPWEQFALTCTLMQAMEASAHLVDVGGHVGWQ